MDTPEERLASLVEQAKAVVAAHDADEDVKGVALYLARSVIEYGEPDEAPPVSFSFKLDEPATPPKTA